MPRIYKLLRRKFLIIYYWWKPIHLFWHRYRIAASAAIDEEEVAELVAEMLVRTVVPDILSVISVGSASSKFRSLLHEVTLMTPPSEAGRAALMAARLPAVIPAFPALAARVPARHVVARLLPAVPAAPVVVGGAGAPQLGAVVAHVVDRFAVVRAHAAGEARAARAPNVVET